MDGGAGEDKGSWQWMVLQADESRTTGAECGNLFGLGLLEFSVMIMLWSIKFLGFHGNTFTHCFIFPWLWMGEVGCSGKISFKYILGR